MDNYGSIACCGMILDLTMKLDFKCVIPCTKFNLHLRFRVVYLACTQA